jgi:hypothetical protein
MRILTLILILAISVQPLQAGHCDMGSEQGAAQDASHHMDMGTAAGHDCCDTGADSGGGDCAGGFYCGPCATVVPLTTEFPRIAPLWQRSYVAESTSGVILPSHSSPPYRPPIA